MWVKGHKNYKIVPHAHAAMSWLTWGCAAQHTALQCHMGTWGHGDSFPAQSGQPWCTALLELCIPYQTDNHLNAYNLIKVLCFQMTVLTKQQNNLPMTALSVCAAALTDFPLSSPCSRLLSLSGGSPVSTGAAHTGDMWLLGCVTRQWTCWLHHNEA